MKLGYAAAIAMIVAFPPASDASPQCDAQAFGVQIDQTAQSLRTLNRESERRFHERLEALGKQRGWTEAQKADKAAAAMDDSKLEAFNADIEELVAKLDMVSATPNNEVSCARLNELKAVQEKLVAVMGQKSGFILAQLEAEAAKAPLAPYTPAAVSSAPEPPPPSADAARPAAGWPANVAQTPPARAQAPAQRQAAPPAQPGAPLQLRPAASQQNTRVAALPRQSGGSASSQAPAVANGYSADEIRAVGNSLFGSFSSEFAMLVNHSFEKYGRPNAYIAGDEGGGAFLAGLRYGDGKLYTRLNGVDSEPARIYWQGPSIGADLGAAGSQTLFLVYNLQNPAELYRRFPGIDGSAYIAGGLGLTVYRKGDTLIVPIRSGLGLRLGASLTYLKFTERASWNPF